jgi:NAD(P)-binding Rossmann-like domain
MHVEDITIIGGGMTGLYLLYQIVRKRMGITQKDLSPITIGLYEKNDYFGGRIYTERVKVTRDGKPTSYKFECGAARFCEKHHLFIQLLQELELYTPENIGRSTAVVKFVPSAGYREGSPEAAAAKKSPYVYVNKVIHYAREKGDYTDTGRIVKSGSKIMNYSFIEYALKYRILSGAEVKYLCDSFGYVGEIEAMNAFNAIHMFSTDLNQRYKYFSLRGGLDQIPKKMIQFIHQNKRTKDRIVIHRGALIEKISWDSGAKIFGLKVLMDKMKKETGKSVEFQSREVYCAIQRSSLLRLPIFHPIRDELRAVDPKPLCRVYMVFDKEHSGWIAGLGKITSNNRCRYLIPLDAKKGSVMISYTDSRFANAVYAAYQKLGEKGFNRWIVSTWEKVMGIKIGMPIYTRVCYWKEGVAMWKPGYNSLEISAKMRNRPLGPDVPIHVIGENYSLNQAWIEGGLSSVPR